MTYIKLEDVQKILLDYRNDIIYSITDACDKINSLPSIKSYDNWYCKALEHTLEDLRDLWDGWKVPTITIPEWTVLLGKDDYESLKEKAWMYDDLCNS